MHDVLKFGVKFQKSLHSDCLSTLVTVDSSTTFTEILYLTFRQFHPDVLNTVDDFCFLLKDDDEKALTYISAENVGLLDRNLVHLVQIPSLASKQAIHLLTTELNQLNWSPLQCQTLTNILQELAKLLPCRQFATEFLKNGGHEVIFHLLERYPIFDPHQTVYFISGSVSSPDPTVWSTLVACLAELSEYSVNSSGVLTDEDRTTEANDSAFLPDTNSSDSFGYSLPESLLNEVFSWHLASERFLSVLVHQCSTQTELEPLRDGLKVLLKILINCPIKADSVISQLSPDFIFDRLRKVYDSTPIAASSPHPLVNHDLSGFTPRLSTSRVNSATISAPNSCASSPCSRAPSLHADSSATNIDTTTWPNQLLSELNCMLLDMIYLILHRSRQVGRLEEVIPTYLNAPNLRLLAMYFPQLKHPELWSSFNLRTSSVSALQEKASTLKRISDSGPPGLPRCSSTLHRQNSTFSGGHSTFFFPDPSTATSIPSQRFKPSRGYSQRSRTEEDLIDSLHRLQNIQFAFWSDQLKTSSEDEPTTWAEKLQTLCQLATPNWTLTKCADRPSKLHYSRLGFKFPGNPHLDYASPPGLLGYKCLCSFLTHCAELREEILNYGRADLQVPINRSILPRSTWSHSPPSRSLIMKRSSGRSQSDRDDSPCGVPPPFNFIPMALGLDNQPKASSTNLLSTPTEPFYQASGTETTDDRPMFPLVESANALTLALSDALDVGGATNLDPLSPSSLGHCHGRFYPMLFQPRTNDLTPFEELFVCAFPVLFYSWTHLNACADDLEMVLSVLREQLSQTLLRTPVSLDEFEEQLSRFTPQIVRSIWREQEERSQRKMLQSHAALRELHIDLTKAHELNVREQRLNALTCRAPLDYVPQKGTRQFGRDNQKMEVVLSPDRKSLVLRDTKQCVRELWPLVCVDRVSTGVEEKLKKNPERSLLLHIRIRESPEPLQILLVARCDLDYKYWIDGFHILLRRGMKSDQFDADVQFLVDLDMKIRLCSLDSLQLPSGPQEIPPDPPEFDFEEDCEI